MSERVILIRTEHMVEWPVPDVLFVDVERPDRLAKIKFIEWPDDPKTLPVQITWEIGWSAPSSWLVPLRWFQWIKNHAWKPDSLRIPQDNPG